MKTYIHFRRQRKCKNGSWKCSVSYNDSNGRRRMVADVYHESSEELMMRRGEATAIAVLLVHHGQPVVIGRGGLNGAVAHTL